MVHVVIPMSGEGRRFREAGYTRPKPLIAVDGEPMISYVVSMFPHETRFTFICNREHLDKTDLRETLQRIMPSGQILAIEPHKKGPVWAVAQCFDAIDDDEEVIINYCDFYSYWNYTDFLHHTRSRNAAGCVPAYHGFHPHMLGTDNYAFIRDKDQWLQAIQEKKPFTDNRMQEFASNGTYYFGKGRYVKTYFQRLIDRGVALNGEFYVSMVYNLMVEDGLPISVYEVQHMLQWGTPGDLEEYQNWSDYFVAELTHGGSKLPSLKENSAVLLPMSGKGSRFQQVGIKTPKALLNVSGKPMFVQATASLPHAQRYVFVCLKEMFTAEIKSAMEHAFPNASAVLLEEVTRGQAQTCAMGISMSDPPIDRDAALMIGACDNGMLLDNLALQDLLDDPKIDAIAFTFRNHPSAARKPEMYGWIKVLDGTDKAAGVSVKKPISSNPRDDHAIVGAFYFRKAGTFLDAFDRMVAQNVLVNNEFYVDSLFGVLIEMGHDCRVFDVASYICWGTPDDWHTFRYWQSFFHKCSWHPYRIELDPNADAHDKELKELVEHRLTQACR